MAGAAKLEGIINVLKPPGMTSHDVVSFLRRTLGEKRIGHSGTLDPQAAGVLPVCVGGATRLADYLGEDRKSYLCQLTLGMATDTQDAWGQPLATKPVPELTQTQIEQAVGSFLGCTRQKVPAYSAVKVGGQPLYKAARQGLATAEIYRDIQIFQIKVIQIQLPKIKIWVECAKGTYIRALCQDLGQALGTTAYMSFLLRTSVGAFTLDQAQCLEDIALLGSTLLQPKELAVASLPALVVSPQEQLGLEQGRPLWLKKKPEFNPKNQGETQWAEAACFNKQGSLVALGNWTLGEACQAGAGVFKPRKVFHTYPQENN